MSGSGADRQGKAGKLLDSMIQTSVLVAHSGIDAVEVRYVIPKKVRKETLLSCE